MYRTFLQSLRVPGVSSLQHWRHCGRLLVEGPVMAGTSWSTISPGMMSLLATKCLPLVGEETTLRVFE